MKKQGNLGLSMKVAALGTCLLLLIPFMAMQFTTEVNWSVFDFVIMGALIFITGTILMLVFTYQSNLIYKLAMAIAIGTTFIMIWANLAVGLIGSGPNLGNLLYLGVLFVFIAGILLSNFKSQLLERAMFATALAIVLVMIIALTLNMQQYPGSSVNEIVGVNLFFATPFFVSGLLFRFVNTQQLSTPSH